MIIIEIAGHLGADPETRVTATGQKVTTLRIAANIRSGEKEETVWWRVTVWGSDYDNMIKHLKKGSALIVIGDMNKAPEIYTDRSGRQQVSMQITARYLRFNPFGGKGERPQQQQQPQMGQAFPGNFSQQYNGQAQEQHEFAGANTFGANAGGYVSSGLASEMDSEGEEEAPPF